jgi:hypothetical protein
MGWFGTRRIDGEVFVKQGDFQSQEEAYVWQKKHRASGYKCHVIPNSDKRVYEVWVSEMPTLGMQKEGV